MYLDYSNLSAAVDPRRTNDPNGLNWAKNAEGKIVQHLYYQANPNSTGSPWSGGPANDPAW